VGPIELITALNKRRMIMYNRIIDGEWLTSLDVDNKKTFLEIAVDPYNKQNMMIRVFNKKSGKQLARYSISRALMNKFFTITKE
jgi:hypothetical protein